MIGGDVDLFVGGAGEVGAGGILILRGPDAGKFVAYLDYGVGLGLDLSIVAEGGVIFYTGDASKFTMDHLRGNRTEVAGAFGTIRGNVFWAPQDADGERVIGVLGSLGPGINPITLFTGIPVPWTFNVNHGSTEKMKKYRLAIVISIGI